MIPQEIPSSFSSLLNRIAPKILETAHARIAGVHNTKNEKARKYRAIIHSALGVVH